MKNKNLEALALAVNFEELLKLLKIDDRTLNTKQNNRERMPGHFVLNQTINFLNNILNSNLINSEVIEEVKAAVNAHNRSIEKAKEIEEMAKIKEDDGSYTVTLLCDKNQIGKLIRRLKKLQTLSDYLVSRFERNSKITRSQAELFFYIGLVLSEAERMKKELIA